MEEIEVILVPLDPAPQPVRRRFRMAVAIALAPWVVAGAEVWFWRTR